MKYFKEMDKLCILIAWILIKGLLFIAASLQSEIVMLQDYLIN